MTPLSLTSEFCVYPTGRCTAVSSNTPHYSQLSHEEREKAMEEWYSETLPVGSCVDP